MTVDAFTRGNAAQYMKGRPLPTIGVVTTVHTYTHFLDQWAAGVRGLQEQPDRIVIAATDPEQVRKHLDGKLPHYTVVQANEPFGLGKYLNTAIDSCRTDLIVWAGVDDRYRPQALNGLRFIDADVIGMGMRYVSGREWIPSEPTAAQVLQVQENLLPCGSAFQRKFWAARPFQPDLAPFEDWALWVGFAALGARFASTKRIDFDYNQHADQIVPPLEPTRTRIAEWAKGLT
jgi:hypothetical protein